MVCAFVASQANHAGFMIGGVKTQYPAENKHGRLILVLYYSSLSTLTRSILILHNFVANLTLLRLRAFCGGTFGRNLAAGGTKTFKWTGHLRLRDFRRS